MRFASHLRDNLVPEWRSKYFDYKTGKKKLKKIIKKSSPKKAPSLPTALILRTPRTPRTPAGSQGGQGRDAYPHSGNTVSSASDGGYGSVLNRINTVQLPPPALPQTSTENQPRKKPNRIQISDHSPLLVANEPSQSPRAFTTAHEADRDENVDGDYPTSSPESTAHLEQDFISWVDSEVSKIDTFYTERENEDIQRLARIECQLGFLREHRKTLKENSRVNETSELLRRLQLPSLPESLKSAFKSLSFYPDKDTAKNNQPTPVTLRESERAFEGGPIRGSGTRARDTAPSIAYSSARRQLRIALVDFYRGIELLKGYRALNKTAIRKMMKKYDKTTGNRVCDKYMQHVEQMNFAKSDKLDRLLSKIEDLYSMNFENGNHKQAVDKLRAEEKIQTHYFCTIFMGLCLGAGIPLFIEAIVAGVQRLDDPNTAFLFQIWGGFFVVNLILCLFTINALVWTTWKINYPFIFEFDPRHYLSWQEYGVLPCFFMFFLSLMAWLTFHDFWSTTYPAYYYPPIYLGVALLVLFLPLPILFPRARKWFLVTLWRLLCSGLYPVEFRDFFMGDIVTSLAYSLSDCAFFFCAYSHYWTNYGSCTSSQSRVLGFLESLPAIFRFLQCLRRFADSGDAFPHLANAGKYSCSIVYYMTLSLWRIEKSSTSKKGAFIAFGAMNTIYSSFWDIFMDWSLMQPGSKYWFLRDELGFGSPYPYYAAMIVDPLLRCLWINYAIFSDYVQMSQAISFFVALGEILRRFIWLFFRVENEHCTNVGRFRATRDMVLPYSDPNHQDVPIENSPDIEQQLPSFSPRTEPSASWLGQQQHGTPSTLRRRGTLYELATPVLRAASTAIKTAHARDFERKRRDQVNESDDDDDLEAHDHSDSDESIQSSVIN